MPLRVLHCSTKKSRIKPVNRNYASPVGLPVFRLGIVKESDIDDLSFQVVNVKRSTTTPLDLPRHPISWLGVVKESGINDLSF